MDQKKPTFGDALYLFFHGFALAITLFVMLFLIIQGEGELSGIAPITLCFMFFQYFFIKLGQRNYRPLLNVPGKKYMRLKNIGICFLVFNLMIIATVIFLSLNKFTKTGAYTDRLLLTASTVLLWLGGVMSIWILVFQQLTNGVQNIFKTYITFVRDRVSIHFLYQVFIFVITLIGGLIIVNLTKDGSLPSNIAAESFFQYVLGDSLANATTSGFLSGNGTFVGGLTSAASYFVLCELVSEHMEEDETPSFGKRILRMFTQKDTIILLVMTLFCIIITFAPLDNIFNLSMISEIGIGVYAFVFVVSILWLVSMIEFWKTTKLVPYFVTFFSMSFVEGVLPLPKSFILSVFVVAIRILIFAMLAIIISAFTKSSEERQKYIKSNNIQNTSTKAEAKAYNATPLTILAGAIKTGNAIKNAPDKLADTAKNKMKKLFK